MFSQGMALENARVRRVTLLSQKASARRLNDESKFYQKINERKSRAFTQKILLYLAESSQLRHQRQARINKITKMFRVPLDEAEHIQMMKQSQNQTVKEEEKKELKKKPEEVDRQSVQRSLSNASELSLTSSIEDANRRVRLSQKSRTLSICVIEDSPGMLRRRLSAPEVVITIASGSAETENDLRPNYQQSFMLTEEEGYTENAALPAPMGLSKESAQSGTSSRSRSPSTFRSYSRATPLLKRMASHDSTSSSRKQSQEYFPMEEVPNAVADPRFVDLLAGLHIYNKTEQAKLSSEAMSLKKQPKT